MKKVLSVLLMLGMLLSVGFASEVINKKLFKKSDVDLLNKLKIPVNSIKAKRIIKLVDLKINLLNAYVEYKKNPTKKLELEIIKIMDTIDNLKSYKINLKFGSYEEGYQDGYELGVESAKEKAAEDAMDRAYQDGREAGSESVDEAEARKKGYEDAIAANTKVSVYSDINIPIEFNCYKKSKNYRNDPDDDYQNGREKGFDDGYAATYDEALKNAMDSDKAQTAYDQGYRDGANATYNYEYQKGYEDGLEWLHEHGVNTKL
jgi:flagellar biosynthesis/type III secretory pathway protein FliH